MRTEVAASEVVSHPTPSPCVVNVTLTRVGIEWSQERHDTRTAQEIQLDAAAVPAIECAVRAPLRKLDPLTNDTSDHRPAINQIVCGARLPMTTFKLCDCPQAESAKKHATASTSSNKTPHHQSDCGPGVLSRRMMHHLAFFKGALAIHGLKSTAEPPVDGLSAAVEQLETLVRTWSNRDLVEARPKRAIEIAER